MPRQEQIPGVLRHLVRLTEAFPHGDQSIHYLHCYARPEADGSLPPLHFIRAAESGPEGIGCVDDAARAVLLALEVAGASHTPSALTLARQWLEFVVYMQEPDGNFINFILDRSGRKNRRGRTSYAGGPWWMARAAWALAAAGRVTGEERYLKLFERTRITATPNLKVTAVQALALLDYYAVNPDESPRRRIRALCDRLAMGARGSYLRDRKGHEAIRPWGYHQLQALARAGRVFARSDYLAVCEHTVERVIAPLVGRSFAQTDPWQRAPQCAYDVSSIMLGLEELYLATGRQRYRRLALTCGEWLYGRNPSGVVLYDPRTGRCQDGIVDGEASSDCGSESAIEAGFVELARRRLWHAATRQVEGRDAPAARRSAR